MNLARRIQWLLPLLVLLGAWAPVQAAETPIPPVPGRWVTDNAGFLSASTRAALDARLEAYERVNGHQVVVYIGKTTGDAPIEDWAVRAFKAWKVGRKATDDGVALFIMADDHKLRIEVGYGLEGTVPDAIASRIINDVMVPRIRAGDQDGAVTAGLDALLEKMGGKDPGRTAAAATPRQHRQAAPQEIGLFQMIVFGLLGLALLFFIVTNPSLALWLLVSILSDSRRGGGGYSGGRFSGGGGGFSGGGGSSGGGGASGSW